MRGKIENQVIMLSSLSPDQLVPQDHPIRRIKPIVEHALSELSPIFNRMYAEMGRPSIPPEHLLKACLLIALYSIRSERQFCERLQYDLLFKWFLDLNIMDAAFDASSFSKNKERLLEHQVTREFLTAVISDARRRKLLSEDHFTVDGTLLEAWASLKSFRPKDGGATPTSGANNPGVDFHSEHRTNDTHQSSTDPEARLAKKGAGKEARLCFAGHLLMENRTGLVVDVKVTRATGTAERDTALDMIEKVPGKHRITVGGGQGLRHTLLCYCLPGY
jgi:transposase